MSISLERLRRAAILLLCLSAAGSVLGRAPRLAPPEADGLWIRPAASFPAEPIWGHAEGLRVGLWPTSGPRGLLRIYTPYLGHDAGRMINYIAVEPKVVGKAGRGYSELEWSQLDRIPGLRFWSAGSGDETTGRSPQEPVRGTVSRHEEYETLSVIILIEPYRNGAHVYLELTFHSDRPYEVGIATFAHPDSAPLEACIVTATMGNYAQLRTLHLADRTVRATSLWPGFTGTSFTDHVCFAATSLIQTAWGGVVLVATPLCTGPKGGGYAPGTPQHWQYSGVSATQYWRQDDPSPELHGCVNGRLVYWGTSSPIPGGVSFENVELVEPFRQGAVYWFGVKPGLYEPSPTLMPAL